MHKTTLVIGASENPERYSYKAVSLLQNYNIPVYALGNKEGKIGNVEIDMDKLPYSNIDTVSLYLSPKNQEDYKRYIISLKPNRVIFNPGTENPDFYNELSHHGIAHEEACTLVLLNIGMY